MKKYSALKEMFYGNRGQHDTIKIEDEDVEVLDTIIECEDILKSKLKDNPELLDTYTKLDSAISELNLVEIEHYYIEGFKFGFLMAMDVFDFNNN